MTDKELEQIYNEAYKAVYWTAMSLLKNEADAEDIVQDTFVTLIKSYDSIRDKSKVTSWLKKTAANKCLDRIKLAKTDNVDEEFFDSIEAVSEDFLPDSIVESEDSRKLVMDIINNSLSEDIRRTLILFYFDEMSTREVAESLGILEGTVSKRIHFAKKKIKKEVEKYEEENDTKLFMVVPFLTQLFTKEAEQVPLRPMPASLVSLSASTKAAEAAGSKLASQAITKGTGIAMKKIIITIVSVVLAGSVTAGIIYVATKKDKESSVKDKAKKNAANEIATVDPVKDSEGTTSEESESVEAASTETMSDVRVADSAHFYVNGKEIILGQSTVQDLYDTGCYCIFYDATLDYSQTYFYTLDDEVEFTSAWIYPDEAMAEAAKSASPTDTNGGIFIYIYAPKDLADNETYKVKDGIVMGVRGTPNNASLWGENLTFDFPLTMTPEQLVANSGEPDVITDNMYHYNHSKEYEYVEFTYDENDKLTDFKLLGGS